MEYYIASKMEYTHKICMELTIIMLSERSARDTESMVIQRGNAIYMYVDIHMYVYI